MVQKNLLEWTFWFLVWISGGGFSSSDSSWHLMTGILRSVIHRVQGVDFSNLHRATILKFHLLCCGLLLECGLSAENFMRMCKVLIFWRAWSFYSHALYMLSTDDSIGQKRHVNIGHINNFSVTPVTDPPGWVSGRKCRWTTCTEHASNKIRPSKN